MPEKTDPIQDRDVVKRKNDPARKPPRGVVIQRFMITEHRIQGMPSMPVEAGDYAVVIWHNRMTLRVEPVEDLEKVGYLERP